MQGIAGNRGLGYKIISISFIVISFLLYAVTPFNVCLPFSACVIAGITGGMMVVSEIIFWIGSLMIGREVALKIRKKFSIKNLINYIKTRKEVK
jgi:hypothetical protein